MIGKKINQLATELAPVSTDLTIIGDPDSGVSKKITLAQLGAIFSGAVSFYSNLAGFPATGDINVIYCAKDTQKLYLWSGSAYVEVFPSQALLDTYQLRSEKGVSNGYASLDSGGKVPISQLPSSIMEYKGTWSAATNTPTLANGTGDTGDVYICNVAGSVNFGAGAISFAVGDYVIYSGTIWQRSSGAVGTVTSVAVSRSGDALAITGSPVTTSGTINVGFAGNSTQYINGAGNLVTFPGVINEAQNLITEVYNKTGATLTKGTVVYINGGQGNLPAVTKALATGDSTSAQTYGIVRNDITNNNNGYVVVAGRISDLDTQAYTEGTQLYLSPTTAGTYTSTKPYAPQHLVYVGIVVRAHPTQGVVEVKIQNGYELDELHNVAAQSPSNGDILQYVSSTSLWTKTAGTTSNIAEGSNLYYTDARSRAALSFTAGSGAYNSTTGVITIPTNTNQLTNGANYITLASLSAGAGISYNNTTGVIASTITQYTDANARAAISLTTSGTSGAATYNSTTGVLNVPQYAPDLSGYVPTSRTLTINGTAYDLSANRSWSVGTVTSVGLSSATSGVTIGSTPITSSGTITLAIVTASGSQQGLLSSTDWTTFNNKQSALTNPVTGTGTTNYLPKFTGASTIGNSILSESGYTLTQTSSNALSVYVIKGTGSTTGLWLYTNGVNATLTNQDNGSLAFQTNGIDRLTISSTGAATFSSSVTANARSFIKGSAGYLFDVEEQSSNKARFQSYVASNDVSLVAGYDTTAVPMTFYTGNAERMRISASGNLGLGVTPSASGYKNFQINSTGIIGSASGYIWVGNNWVYNSGDKYIANGTSQLFGLNDGGFQWFIAPSGTAGNAISFTQAMTLDASGRLGIGTTSPLARLHISGTLRNSFASGVGGTNYLNIIDGVSNGFQTTVTSVNAITYTFHNGANAGILTLAESGAATFSSSVTANYISSIISSSSNASPLILQNTAGWGSTQITSISVKDASDVVGAIGWKYDGVANVDMLFHSLYNGAYKTVSNVVMTVKGTGNVGIGTTSPASKLQIGSVGSTGYSISNGLAIGNGTQASALDVDASGLNIYSTNNIIFSPNTTERMRITSGGNVGIGTTSPVVALDFGNVTDKAFHLYSSAGDYYGINMTQYDSVTYSTNIFSGNGGNIKFRTASGTTTQSTRMTITAAGNVGIGTTSPTRLLEVSGSSPSLAVIGTSGSVPQLQLVSGGVVNWSLRTNQGAASDFTIYQDSTERMRITSGGNVGIGTTSPTGKLEIRGLQSATKDLLLNLSKFDYGATNFYQNYSNTFFTNGKSLEIEIDALPIMQLAVNNAANQGRVIFPNGNVEIATGSIKTGEPDTGWGRAAIKIGASVSGAASNVTRYLPVSVDGTVYYINLNSSTP